MVALSILSFGLAGAASAAPAGPAAPAALVALPAADAGTTAADQVLTWTGSNSVTQYASAPATAKAGPATIVFENSVATGNTVSMSHTLTFDTSTAGYNHDVALDILANPLDENGGRWEVDVDLTPGTYRYFCVIPGHGQMVGELVVTEGGGQEDTTAPTVTPQVTGDKDADGAYIGAATVSLAAEDADSGVASVEYALDGGDLQPYTSPLVLNEPGMHMVDYRATDNAGNVSETGTVHVVVVAAGEDTTAPVVSAEVTGQLDDDGAYVGTATVALTATDVGSGVASVEYALDGGEYTAYASPVPVGEPGEHTVTYRATDKAGNVSEPGSTTFTVVEAPEDTTAPVVTAEVTGKQDADGAYEGSATVQLHAVDDGSGVASVEYALDGGDYQEYTAPVVFDEVGMHMLDYRATDKAGNVSEAGMVHVVVVEAGPPPDTTPPIASAQVDGVQDANGVYVDEATVTVTARDSGSGVAFIEYSLDDSAFREYDGPMVIEEPGAHALRYRATDNVGNVTRTGTLRFTLLRQGIDACPASDERATVFFGNLDSRVANVDTGDGCTVADLLDADGPWVSHKAFVSHVTDVAGGIAAKGIITSADLKALVQAAKRSSIGN
ncbi:OmpL47-type beta-barrel domain-containing protein [Isoptericola sp. NPDC057559]|uniref:cupredoxin domain-containing protein n=1 Tax=Isoptericola sp. NPDC057559 TaxID=3346168 RepID=UPI0036D06818